MKSLFLFLILSVLLSVSAIAADGKPVSYKSGDETVNGILYTPAGQGPFPALIVIHEWWGLNDWVKQQAAKLAEQGYVALAIDLYRGKVADNPDMAHELMRGVPEDRANRDLRAAYDFLASQPNVKKDRIGSIGWCMGGGYALDVALAEPHLAGAIINYGHLATDPAEAEEDQRSDSWAFWRAGSRHHAGGCKEIPAGYGEARQEDRGEDLSGCGARV